MNNQTIRSLFILSVLLSIISCNNSKSLHHSKKQTTVFDDKVDSLMNLMTLEEKIGQTVMYSGSGAVTGPTVNADYRTYIKEGNVGAMLNVYSVKGTRELQKLAVEETRLRIPL